MIKTSRIPDRDEITGFECSIQNTCHRSLIRPHYRARPGIMLPDGFFAFFKGSWFCVFFHQPETVIYKEFSVDRKTAILTEFSVDRKTAILTEFDIGQKNRHPYRKVCMDGGCLSIIRTGCRTAGFNPSVQQLPAHIRCQALKCRTLKCLTLRCQTLMCQTMRFQARNPILHGSGCVACVKEAVGFGLAGSLEVFVIEHLADRAVV